MILAAAASPIGKAATTRAFPSELKRITDPATEFPVIRLTSLEYNSSLPVAANRFISRKSNFLLYASDRLGGKTAIYKLDIKSGENTILAEGLSDRAAFRGADAGRPGPAVMPMGSLLILSPCRGVRRASYTTPPRAGTGRVFQDLRKTA